MKTPSEFDDIRPYDPHELPQVYDRLLANEQFVSVIKYLYPDIPIELFEQKMRQCKTGLEFQRAFCYQFIHDILKKASTGCRLDCSNLDVTKNYTFISNHRDIVLDSGILDVMMIDEGFTNTCEIAIGDNLLSLPWVYDLVRLNKAFIVKRGLSVREQLAASIQLSKYMHYAINEKKEHLWIAQREGRAKDSNDRTQKAIIKMLILSGEGSIIEKLQSLHLVPVSISYEYDPCDYLKAAEMQLKRDDPEWKKSAADDVLSMQTGIMGYKGEIFYYAAPCIDEYLETLKDRKEPTSKIIDEICAHIDNEIHKNYKLYANNYIALDELNGTNTYSDKYSEKERQAFCEYIQSRINKIEISQKDEAFLREQLLRMYANPTLNYLYAHR